MGDPIVGIPFSVSGEMANPHVQRVRATAIAGALLQTLQSVVMLPVQLLGAGDVSGEAGAPAPDMP